MTGVFVTGTDTGVGKTWVALGLMAAFQAQGRATVGMKPVASGCEPTAGGLRNADALWLQRQASLPLPYEWVNPCALAPAVAPHIAAQEAGRRIEIAPLREAFERLRAVADLVVVEGVGGWRVPLNERETVADLARALGLPLVLVVGIRLGCLNHALLTRESIAQAGQSLAGWVANRMDPQCARADANIEALCARLDAPLLGVVPPLPALDVPAIARVLDLSRLPG